MILLLLDTAGLAEIFLWIWQWKSLPAYTSLYRSLWNLFLYYVFQRQLCGSLWSLHFLEQWSSYAWKCQTAWRLTYREDARWPWFYREDVPGSSSIFASRVIMSFKSSLLESVSILLEITAKFTVLYWQLPDCQQTKEYSIFYTIVGLNC